MATTGMHKFPDAQIMPFIRSLHHSLEEALRQRLAKASHTAGKCLSSHVSLQND